MDIVLDTVAVNHLLRNPKKTKDGSSVRFSTCLDAHLREAAVRIRIDPTRALVHEWERTCGADNIRALIVHWDQWSQLHPVQQLGGIPGHISKRLRLLGFTDAIDKLVLKIALVTHDHVAVSEDSDFWKPGTPSCRGDDNAPVARCCADDLGLRIFTVARLMNELR